MSYRIVCGPDQILSEMCKSRREWGMYMSLVPSAGIGPYEISRAAPFLSEEDSIQFWHAESALFFFPTEEEMVHHYRQVKGDNGPSRHNPYDGPASIYATTCSPLGMLLDVNT